MFIIDLMNTPISPTGSYVPCVIAKFAVELTIVWENENF